MVAFRFDDATGKWGQESAIEGFHPLNRPQRTASGNWVMGGQYGLIFPHVAISHGDDLTQWDVVEIPSGPEHKVNFAETSLVVERDTITAYVRTDTELLHVSESTDGGRSWRRLAASNLQVSTSKTCAGVLSTGQRYLAFNMREPDTHLWSRNALAIAVSAPGERSFQKIVLVRNGKAPAYRVPGFAKGPQWSYPSVEEYGGNVYIAYTVTKEDCCLSVLPLSEFGV